MSDCLSVQKLSVAGIPAYKLNRGRKSLWCGVLCLEAAEICATAVDFDRFHFQSTFSCCQQNAV